METRTEEDKLIQAPVKVILGGKEYEVKPLPVKYAVPWVKRLVNMMVEAAGFEKVTTDTPDLFREAMTAIMADDPAEMVEMFFAYARELDRATIEESASSAEVMSAFGEVVKLELPLLRGLTRLTTIAR